MAAAVGLGIDQKRLRLERRTIAIQSSGVTIPNPKVVREGLPNMSRERFPCRDECIEANRRLLAVTKSNLGESGPRMQERVWTRGCSSTSARARMVIRVWGRLATEKPRMNENTLNSPTPKPRLDRAVDDNQSGAVAVR